MSGDSGEERTVLVDASVFITLAKIDSITLLRGFRGEIRIPATVVQEIETPPSSQRLARAEWISRSVILGGPSPEINDAQVRAAEHLGHGGEQSDVNGDVALLTLAILHEELYERPAVVVTDDKPLRKTCKALSIPVAGSIGVLVRAVERGDLEGDVAKEKLYAMDEVGARLSASLIKRAESLIEEADKG